MSLIFRSAGYPFELFEVDLLKAEDRELLRISEEMGLALNLNEMRSCRDYFRRDGRNPTDIEMQTIGQTWSEHCYHKTFRGSIKSGKKEMRLFRDFIFRPTRKMSPPWCISVFEDNAGIVAFERGQAIAVKVETHNHPSAIEPFGGAATGVGGVIRDILGVWAKPVANIDVLGFGPLDYRGKLPSGVKHPRYIFRGVVAGIGAYGNNMGIPTVAGGIFFDESYVGNPVVYCGCVGILRLKEYVKKTRPGDVVVLAGGRTGRDGIHGVTFASVELTAESEEIHRPAVQIPDPIQEEKLRRAILRIGEMGLASGITDLGGGGLSCAACEMANRSGCGVYVELDKVPLKYSGMRPWEIWISESQERMLLSVPEKNVEKVLDVFSEEEVEATVIGRFERGRRARVSYQGREIMSLDLKFLFSPPLPERTIKTAGKRTSEPVLKMPGDLEGILLRLLSSPNITSRESVVRTYDHEVQGATVIKPLHGRHGGPSDAAVIKPLPESRRGVVISCGMRPRYGRIDAYWMAASSIEEAIRNNVAAGGRRIALLDNFVWGNPEKEEQLASLVRACEACRDFSLSFRTPFISGKDSLYNESPLGPITPTLLITAVGVIPDVRSAVSVDLKREGDAIYVVGRTYRELGGSEYYALFGELGSEVPVVRARESSAAISSVLKAIDSSCVRSCHDISDGGLGVAVAEMVLSSDLGAEINLDNIPAGEKLREDHLLFSESNGRFIVEVKKGKERKFERTMKCPFVRVGEVNESGELTFRADGRDIIRVSGSAMREAWQSGLRL
ncbi:MAG: phosphoribosylformylglycinamidine synthase subunit PurL [Candidatus Hadarchaeales archaeon]